MGVANPNEADGSDNGEGPVVIDILTDRMGVMELNLEAQREKTENLHKSMSSLHAVNEKLRDTTLEDCAAFTDLKHKHAKHTKSVSNTSCVLTPLEEEED